MTAALLQGVPGTTLDADLWINLPERQYVRVLDISRKLGATILARRLLKYWSGPRVEAEGMDGKERVRRIPAAGCNDRATRPAALLPRACRVASIFPLAGVARLVEIAADIDTAFAPWPARKSIATRPTPVFQQSPKTVVALSDDTLVNFLYRIDGLEKFDLELRSAVELEWLGLRVAVLPLQSIIKSKRAVARPKDIAHLPLLEQTQRSLQS